MGFVNLSTIPTVIDTVAISIPENLILHYSGYSSFEEYYCSHCCLFKKNPDHSYLYKGDGFSIWYSLLKGRTFTITLASVSSFMFGVSQQNYDCTVNEKLVERIIDKVASSTDLILTASMIKNAKVSRVDIRKDIYLSKENHVATLIDFFRKMDVKYSKFQDNYDTTVKSGSKSSNLTVYDKRCQCLKKKKFYVDLDEGAFCVRVEAQIKGTALHNMQNQRPTFAQLFSNTSIKNSLWEKYVSEKCGLGNVILSKNQISIITESTCYNKRKDCADSIRKCFTMIQDEGATIAKSRMKNTYYTYVFSYNKKGICLVGLDEEVINDILVMNNPEKIAMLSITETSSLKIKVRKKMIMLYKRSKELFEYFQKAYETSLQNYFKRSRLIQKNKKADYIIRSRC